MSPTKATEDETASDEPVEEAVEGVDSTDDSTDGGASSEEELSAEDELDLKRLEIALTTLDDESLRRGLSCVTEKQRQDLALQLNLPRATVHLGVGLAPLVRRKLRGIGLDRQHAVSTALTQRVNDTTVDALGDNAEDPSREDLEAVLPAVIDEYGVNLVRLMLASYAISDAPVREVMRGLLDTDERFALPDEVPDDVEIAEDLPSFGLVARVPAKKGETDPERAELLERRKAAKAERRAAAQRERAAKAAAQATRRQALHASKHKPAAT
jgi:hypothetical protein